MLGEKWIKDTSKRDDRKQETQNKLESDFSDLDLVFVIFLSP